MVSEIVNGVKTVPARSRADWRAWLEQHHHTESSVWLIIYHKNSQNPSIFYDEAVEEALCFGWIDSKPNKRDDESYYLFFAQRNPKSNWSQANKERAVKMIELGLMTPSGQTLIDLAKQTGTWDALTDVQSLVIPDDLQAEFDQHPVAFGHFQAFPPSSKRIILEWILNAKKPETRRSRIVQTVELAEINKKANHYRQ